MNILLLTTHFPSVLYDNKLTKMGYYYAREWQKSGNGVRVVRVIPEFITDVAKVRSKANPEPFEYEGVRALELVTARFIPRCSHVTRGRSAKLARDAVRFLDGDGFRPELIIVDFPVPLWTFARLLARHYGCKAAPLFHNCDLYNYLSKASVRRVWRQSETVGVRSLAIEQRLRDVFGCTKPAYWAKSGVPDEIFDAPKPRSSSGAERKIVYVGSLIARKNVDCVLRALAGLRDEFAFTLTIAGEGERGESLRSLCTELGMDDRVTFAGQLERSAALELMRSSDCFVTVSSSETFGMVYVEAMASGCYVIGSRGEGIDGVLIDGVNGALVAPGSVEELTEALRHYFTMPPEETEAIVDRAYEDARSLTESAVAADVLAALS